MIKDFLDVGKFLTALTSRGIIILLLSIIIGTCAYRIIQMQNEINKKDAYIDSLGRRYSDNISYLEKQVEECNKERLREANENQKYFRDRYDKIEERSLQTYKTVKEIKIHR